MEDSMKITATYRTSVKDGSGALHTYGLDVEMEVEEKDLTGEQKLAKMRAVSHFLHNELHRTIQSAQIADGIPPSLTHKDTKPPETKKK
jgi:hypothetical protein